MTPSVLLFDLGGVLVDFAGVAELRRLLPTELSEAEVEARWNACAPSLAFGGGRLDTDTFVARFREDWGISLPPEDFVAAYRSWARGWLPGALDLLGDLRGRFVLAALSNNNPLHWDRLTRELGLLDAFDHAWASHELGVRKPDPEIFRLALARLGQPAERVLFFDDAPGNVAVARSLGLQAEVVDGPAAVRAALVARGLL
ncbi:hydrolase [Luteitalea sp. TBR-22]|uniref:HAD family hydrolase n=1 Tax=Luteitalea sp. TBR-22 TaxID=2802971 RepID=UPI001AF3B237|nr:HAD family phosphatase [Luteitalea sp. TBR-22]BCS31904.1 hydrolase [Luteitalea sp. TBR-22]